LTYVNDERTARDGGTKRTGSVTSLTMGSGCLSQLGARSAVTRIVAGSCLRLFWISRPTSNRTSSDDVEVPPNDHDERGVYDFS
jgi:hypothetical protein